MVMRGSQPGPFFKFKDGHALTRDRLVSGMSEAMTAAGIDPSHYSGHSFRIGAATTAAPNGIRHLADGKVQPTHCTFGHQSHSYAQWQLRWCHGCKVHQLI